MILTRDNFPQLLTPIHRQIFYDNYLDTDVQYTKIVDEDDMRKREETYVHESGFGTWDANSEGNNINEDQKAEGPTATLEAIRYDKGYTVTWELVEDDLYKVFDGRGEDGSARSLSMGLHQTIELGWAKIYGETMFDGVGYDGVAGYSDAHPLANSNVTDDNLVVGELTPENVKAGLTLMRRQRNEAALKIHARANQLIVGPENEFTANEIVKSYNQAFEDSNTTNSIPNLEICVFDYLDPDNVKYSNSWHLRDTRFKNMVQGWRSKPNFDSHQLQKKVDYFFYGIARWDQANVNYRGLVGSTGE